LGRFIGIAFFVPFLFFWLTGRIGRHMVPRLFGLFLLGGAQGALGWYMVMSGLVDRVDVSQYRLAAHLSLATIIFAAIFWTALGIGREGPRQSSPVVQRALIIVGLIFVQVALGGFVAGLDAGMGYNTWPLMDGAFIPNGLLIMDPAWRNFFENAMTVQFQHRIMAYILIAMVVFHWAFTCWNRRPEDPAILWLRFMLFAALIQMGLGIWTLLAQVPITLGLLHQGGALVLLAVTLTHLHHASLKSSR
jgi:cytochrome c oxidase assembly protein subunit 15